MFMKRKEICTYCRGRKKIVLRNTLPGPQGRRAYQLCAECVAHFRKLADEAGYTPITTQVEH